MPATATLVGFFSLKMVLIGTLAAAVIAGAAYILQLHYLPGFKSRDTSLAQYAPVGRVIAFDAVVLLALGIVAVVAASDRWAVACLWSGAALFTGFFIGILFGVPLGATASAAKAANRATSQAQPPDPNNPDQPPPDSKPAPGHNQTLLVEAASWLSKFLAGATFAQARNILAFLTRLSRDIGGYVGSAGAPHVAALGGGVLFYFGSLGFLAGLLLPSIFLDGF